jgi:hypothetical protein
MYGGDTMTLPLHWTRLTYGSPSLISDKSRMRTWWRTGNLRRAAPYSVWPRLSCTKHFHRAILSLKPEIHYSAHKSQPISQSWTKWHRCTHTHTLSLFIYNLSYCPQHSASSFPLSYSYFHLGSKECHQTYNLDKISKITANYYGLS